MAEAHWSHDIQDPSLFVGKVISRSHLDLDQQRRERLHQFLLIALWELSLVYCANGKPSSFSSHAGNILPKRIIDWERTPEEGGRTRWQFSDRVYERELPALVPLDDRPDEPVHVEPLDASAYSDSAARRVLRERRSELAGRDIEVGAATSRAAA